jgi:uncharacterized membrane protein
MESRAKLLGHPVHPMLIVFPLGLLATAVALDIVALAQNDPSWFRISFWMIAAGIIGGQLSAVFGLVDWLAIPGGTWAKRIGLWHGGGNVVVTVLFIISWFLRRPAPERPTSRAFVLSFIAVAYRCRAGAREWLAGRRAGRQARRRSRQRSSSECPKFAVRPPRIRGRFWDEARGLSCTTGDQWDVSCCLHIRARPQRGGPHPERDTRPEAGRVVTSDRGHNPERVF